MTKQLYFNSLKISLIFLLVFNFTRAQTYATFSSPSGTNLNVDDSPREETLTRSENSKPEETATANCVTFGTRTNDITYPNCNGGSPTLTYTSVTGNTRPIEWQTRLQSGSQSSWVTIPGANTATYIPGTVNQSRIYRIFTRGTCGAVFSPEIRVNVPALSISSPQGTRTVDLVNNASIPVLSYTIQNANTYQWEHRTDNSTFTNAPGASTGQQYNPSGITQTTYYRLKVTGTCNTLTGATITVTINSAVSIGNPSANQVVCTGGTPPRLSYGTLSNANSYRWEQSTDNNTFSDALGASTGQTYAPPSLTQTTYYRLKAGNGVDEKTGAVITVTVDNTAVVVNTPSSNQTITCGTTPAALSYGTLQNAASYQWERSTTSASAGYEPIDGATSKTYIPSSSSSGISYYRLKATNPCSEVRGNAITVTVNNNIVVNTPSSNQTITCGTTPAALSYGTVSNEASYQWERSTTSASAGYEPIGGATSKTYIPSSTSSGISYYRLKATNACGDVRGNAITVTVNNNIVVNTPSANSIQTVSCNAIPNTIGYDNVQNANTYQWERSTQSASAGYEPIGGATSQTYTPPSPTVTTYYRLKATNACGDVRGSVITVTFNNGIVVNNPLRIGP